jgi:hypothetical protein
MGKRTEDKVMVTSSEWNLRGAFSTVVAAAIVGMSGLAMDRGHISAAPAGTIEVGELAAVDALPSVAALPEVVVSGERVALAGARTGG